MSCKCQSEFEKELDRIFADFDKIIDEVENDNKFFKVYEKKAPEQITTNTKNYVVNLHQEPDVKVVGDKAEIDLYGNLTVLGNHGELVAHFASGRWQYIKVE